MRWRDVDGATYISPGAAAVLARRPPAAPPPRPKPIHVHLYGDLAAAYAGRRRSRDQTAGHEIEPADPRDPSTGIGPEAAGVRDEEGTLQLRTGDRLTVRDCGDQGFSLATTGAADEGLDELGHPQPMTNREGLARLRNPGRIGDGASDVMAIRAWQRALDQYYRGGR
jgi:hypothetical protein